MAWAVDLERCVDERASCLRLRAKGVLDHIEEREDHRIAGLLRATPRVRLKAKKGASIPVAQCFGDKPVLGAEVLVQSPLRHPCSGGDGVHSRARDAVFIRQLARRPEERVVRIWPVGHDP